MKLINKTKAPKRLRIEGKLIVVKPGKTIEGNKIVYDSRSFKPYIEKPEKTKSSTSVARKKTKRKRRKKK